MGGVLVGGEAGAVSGDLEQHPTRLPKVDGLEVVAVDNRRHAKARPCQPFPPRGVLLLVRGPEGHVMDPSGSYEAMDGEIWALHEANTGAGAIRPDLEGDHLGTAFFVLLRLAEPQRRRDYCGGRGEAPESELDRVEAPNE